MVDLNRKIRHILAIPFIWFLIIPMVLLDIFVEIYHRIGFRLYKIPLIKRSNYIKIDRHKLEYLNIIEKLFCVYCGYANGLAGYLVEIAARTEQYWCGIKHKKGKGFVEPKHHKDFAEYGDKAGFKRKS